MGDVINPGTLRTGSVAINATAFELLAAREGDRPRGGLVLKNNTDDVIYVAMASGVDNDAYIVASGDELALGDYRGAVFVRGDGTGRVHYAYTE